MGGDAEGEEDRPPRRERQQHREHGDRHGTGCRFDPPARRRLRHCPGRDGHRARGPDHPAGDQRECQVGERRDQGRGQADPPDPGRIGLAEGAQEIGAESPAPAAAEFGQDRAQDGIGRGDPEPAEQCRQTRAQAHPAHERPPAAGIGPDEIGRARIDPPQTYRHRGHGREVDSDGGQDDARRHALEGDDEDRDQSDGRQGEERDVDAPGEAGRDRPQREGDRGRDRYQVADREPGERRDERGPDVIPVVAAVGPELDRNLARRRERPRGDEVVLPGELPQAEQHREVHRGTAPGRGRGAGHGSAVP